MPGEGHRCRILATRLFYCAVLPPHAGAGLFPLLSPGQQSWDLGTFGSAQTFSFDYFDSGGGGKRVLSSVLRAS